MNHTLTIAKRELSSLFFSPVAYLVLAVSALVSSAFFFAGFEAGAPAELRWELNVLVWLLVLLVPAISMRLVSEEARSGTLELLMTAPVSDAQVIVGKWLGALAFLLVLLLPLLVQVGVLELTADPDYGPIFTGILGLVLVGGLYLAIGTCLSAVTSSQLIAFILTVLAAGTLSLGITLLVQAAWMPVWLKQALYYIHIGEQYRHFARGLIDIRNFVFFLTGTALFLFVGVKLFESRRWR
ncbi:MAG: ABC transporter permease [Phycisphaeraceae bacterium]